VELLAREASSHPLALLELARDEDSLVRRRAVAGLGALEGAPVNRALRRALEDPSRAVRSAAARASLDGWKRLQADASLRDAVLPVLEADARDFPLDDLKWFRLAAARTIAGDLAGAVEAYEHQLRLDPFATDAREAAQRLRAMLRDSDSGGR
jgi:HEAT repeat protein